LKKPTIIIDQFLDDNECNELIRLFDDNRIFAKPHHKAGVHFLNIGENQPLDQDIMKNVWSMLNNYSLYTVHWAQIYEWASKSFMGMHKDLASRHTVYTSVLYLNDDFSGGRTCFKDGTKIVPKKGRALFYDGVENTHGVSEVENGVRYTVSAWFKEN